MQEFQCPYEILGLNKDCTKEEIRKRYLELSKVYHPDAGGDKNKFSNINWAYHLLYNEESRYQYDNYGKTRDNRSETENKAISYLLNLFEQTLYHPDFMKDINKDIVETLNEVVNNHIHETKKERKKAKKERKRLEKIRERLSTKDGKESIFINHIDEKIRLTKSKIAEIDDTKEYMEKAIEILSNQEYKFEDNTIVRYRMVINSSSGTM